jgi:hypothetical protein
MRDEICDMQTKPQEPQFSERMHLVVSHEWLQAVDDWRRRQPGLLLSRSEAVRELVERQLGLEIPT